MKHILITLIFSLFFFKSFSQTAHADYLDGVVFIKKESTSAINLDPYDNSDAIFNQIIIDYGISEILEPFSGIGSDTLDLTYKLVFDDTMGVDQLILELNALLWVDYAEKSPLFETTYTPNDFNSSQWYLSQINAETGWDYTQGDQNVVIAVVDNAVRITHNDLASNVWVNPAEQENGFDSDLNGYTDDINGYDVADGDNNPNPPSSFTGGAFSHGTSCAGIASGATNNNIGISGVGFNCRIMAVKCTPDNDDGSTLSHAYEGLRYAIDANADIISMSWGSRASSFTGDALLNTAALNGITMFAAAGNNDEESSLSPASNSNVIAVGATNENDERASFSNYGSHIAFMAPGTNIYNLAGGNDSDYGYSNGTSMACPIAAGIGGLILSHYPGFSPEQIENAMIDGCDDIDNLNAGYEGKLGAGRVNMGSIFQILSLEEEKGKLNFKAYPNPANEKITIFSKNMDLNESDFLIYDNMGRSVSDQVTFQQNSNGSLTVNGLVNLGSGVYFLRSQDRKYQTRFIVNP